MVERVSPQRPQGLRFGLERQAFLATLLLLCGIIGAAAMGVFLRRTLSDETERAFETEIPQCLLAHEIMLQVSECGQRDRDFEMQLEDANTRGKALNAWRFEYDRLKVLLDQGGKLASTVEDRERLARWDEGRSAYGEAFVEVADAVEQGDLQDLPDLRDAMNACRSNARQLRADVEAYAESRADANDRIRRAVRDAIKTQTRLISASATIALLVLLLSSLWVTRGILKRVTVLTEAAEQCAAGDRKIRVAPGMNDELGLFAQRFNELVSTIKGSGNDVERANRAADEASHAKSRLLDSLSRELRPPTTTLIANVEMIQDNLRDPENIEAARTVRSKAEHLLGIMDNLHDWSLIEAGTLDIKNGPCDPRQITARIASVMGVLATARGLKLNIEHEGPIPRTIQTDSARLTQILSGLVGNAIQSTELGEVRLVTRFLDEGDDGPKLQFDVVDTGVGWTNQEILHLFDPFARHDVSEEGDTLSVGLGLTIAKRLTDLLGGTITMTSAVGSGSTFSVTIDTGPLDETPMVERPAEVVVEEAEPERNEPVKNKPEKKVTLPRKTLGQPKCRILLAEDGPENQRLMSFILSKGGAGVSVAENGQIAVEMAMPQDGPASSFDVILMDMQMPVMDGYEATRTLRQNGYQGPIVAVTGDTLSFTRQKCIDAGCDDYMSKPVDRAELLSLVDRFSSSEASSS